MWLYLLPVVLVLLARAALRRRRSSTHFPPGPSPLPIVGNIFDFPKQHLGREFATLSKKFGELMTIIHTSDYDTVSNRLKIFWFGL